jgi:hypothetical protein
LAVLVGENGKCGGETVRNRIEIVVIAGSNILPHENRHSDFS